MTGLGSHTRETKGKKRPWYAEKEESRFEWLSFIVRSVVVFLLLLLLLLMGWSVNPNKSQLKEKGKIVRLSFFFLLLLSVVVMLFVISPRDFSRAFDSTASWLHSVE